jgi:hypothetical protein
MTYGICLIKGLPEKRDDTRKFLEKLAKSGELEKKFKTNIFGGKVFISFGWPDIIIIFEAKNVELIKAVVIYLRDRVSTETGDKIGTSTLICTTEEEKEKIVREISSP